MQIRSTLAGFLRTSAATAALALLLALSLPAIEVAHAEPPAVEPATAVQDAQGRALQCAPRSTPVARKAGDIARRIRRDMAIVPAGGPEVIVLNTGGVNYGNPRAAVLRERSAAAAPAPRD